MQRSQRYFLRASRGAELLQALFALQASEKETRLHPLLRMSGEELTATQLMIHVAPVHFGGPPRGRIAAGAPPPPRPVINFTTNLRSPHNAGFEDNTFTKIHVTFIATARATPGT